MSALHTAFVAATLAWALLLLLAPFLASRPHASAVGTALVVAVYAVGSIVCHQLPARSFHLATAQMPVCARCTGIYVGAALAAVALSIRRAEALRHMSVRSLVSAPPRLPFVAQGFSPASARLALALAVAPTLATLVYEWTTSTTPSNWIRFAAGIPIGVAGAWLVRAAAENQVN